MGLTKDNRMTVSLSEVGDSDLIAVLRKVDYDFSRFVRELLRDGLKYRGLGDTVDRGVVQGSTPPPTDGSKKQRKSTTTTLPKNDTLVENRATTKDIKRHVEDKLDSKI